MQKTTTITLLTVFLILLGIFLRFSRDRGSDNLEQDSGGGIPRIPNVKRHQGEISTETVFVAWLPSRSRTVSFT